MTVMAGPRLGWRERWARLENERRQRFQQAAYGEWRRREAEHRHRIGVAIAFRPSRDGGPVAWLKLRRDETVYWVGSDVGMVEPPHASGLRPPDHRALAAALTSAGAPGLAHPLVDTGQVAVTSQRVVFAGRSRREWAYAKLVGLSHTTAGQTLMLATNRKKISGVVPPPAAVADFQLRLALAVADAAGEREDLLHQLETQAAQHRQAAPPAPAPVLPYQAPVSAWFSGGRLLGVVAAAVLVLFCGIGTAMAGGDDSPETSSRTAPTERPTTPTRSPLVAPASPSPHPSQAADTIVDSSPGAAPVGAEAAGGDCAAYLNSGGWCVDGIGDYDCEGGSGNGPNYAPSDVRLAQAGVDPFGLDRDGDGIGCQSRAAPGPAPPPPPPPAPAPPPAAPATDPRFGTCAEAKAAGYGPYYQGQDPEYGWYRDADGDGVVCE